MAKAQTTFNFFLFINFLIRQLNGIKYSPAPKPQLDFGWFFSFLKCRLYKFEWRSVYNAFSLTYSIRRINNSTGFSQSGKWRAVDNHVDNSTTTVVSAKNSFTRGEVYSITYVFQTRHNCFQLSCIGWFPPEGSN